MDGLAGRLAVDAGELAACVADALTRGQHDDGFWREFALQPGPAETWSTAWIGWCLAHVATAPVVRWALHNATRALADNARPEGWGYNRRTGCDADSTAWATLMLAVTAPALACGGARVLLRYVDPAGHAHTFADPRFGDWSDGHGEVTALAALACAAAGCAPERVAPLRAALLAGAGEPFWWDTPTYGRAWRLVALAGTGGIPAPVAAQGAAWLRDLAGGGTTPFEHALQLLALAALLPQTPGLGEIAAWHAHRLIASASPLGWPGSCVLLVPPQGIGGNNDLPRGPHRDSGAMTSALALAALARWRRTLPNARGTADDGIHGGASWTTHAAHRGRPGGSPRPSFSVQV